MSDLRTAAEQEPVAWGVFEGENLHDFFTLREEAEKMAGYKGLHATVMPLYTTPPQRPTEPGQEPVGWFESPRGKFRANPLYKMEFPSSLLKWQIPLFIAPPQLQADAERYRWLKTPKGASVVQLFSSEWDAAIDAERAHGIGGEK